MSIVDRREYDRNKSSANKKRFIDRYKRQVRKSVDEALGKRSIKESMDGGEITIDNGNISEPTFEHDSQSGKKEHVLPGNKEYSKGDSIEKPQSGQGEGRGTEGSDDPSKGEDGFTFTLTKDEFMDLYFSELALPDFIKEGLKTDYNYVTRRAGYTKEGIPARLSIKKTMEAAIARRISTKGQIKSKQDELMQYALDHGGWTPEMREEFQRLEKRKPRYLDDEDVKYNHYKKFPKPIKHAVMFCCMDVSGSMGEYEKTLAKKFYILLYLFLEREYEHVDIRFIRHTTDAKECDEDEFFHSQETGGTVVSSGLVIMKEIIDKEYSDGKTNIYVAQASDGDTWGNDDDKVVDILKNGLLDAVQYYAYVQVEHPSRVATKKEYGVAHDLLTLFRTLALEHRNVAAAHVTFADEIYAALVELFQKED